MPADTNSLSPTGSPPSKTHRYGTRCKNNEFVSNLRKRLAEVESPKAKRASTQSRKRAADANEGADIEKEAASQKVVEEVARIEDKKIRTDAEKKNKHPRNLKGERFPNGIRL
jgi:hypothetical protein